MEFEETGYTAKQILQLHNRRLPRCLCSKFSLHVLLWPIQDVLWQDMLVPTFSVSECTLISKLQGTNVVNIAVNAAYRVLQVFLPVYLSRSWICLNPSHYIVGLCVMFRVFCNNKLLSSRIALSSTNRRVISDLLHDAATTMPLWVAFRTMDSVWFQAHTNAFFEMSAKSYNMLKTTTFVLSVDFLTWSVDFYKSSWSLSWSSLLLFWLMLHLPV